MPWSEQAPILPPGSSWSADVVGAESSANNYQKFRVVTAIARGDEHTVHVRVRIETASKAGYEYTIPLVAQVSVGGTSSYVSSGSYQCGGPSTEWVQSMLLYYSATAYENVSVYARALWNSNACGATTMTAPGYVTTYQYVYLPNGATGGSTPPGTKLFSYPIVIAENGFTWPGHVFRSWNEFPDGSGQVFMPGTEDTGNRDLNLYAQWTADTFTVSYNANGGTGTTESQTKEYGVDLTLRECGFTREGYAFTGWNTKADGTGTEYQAGATFSGNEDTVLYARWKLLVYTVSYNSNGGTGITQSQQKAWGASVSLRECGFEKRGFAFTEWNTMADGTGTAYMPGETYSTNADLALYAMWEKTVLPVWVNDNGTLRQVEKVCVNIDGTIKECEVYVNVDGKVVKIE